MKSPLLLVLLFASNMLLAQTVETNIQQVEHGLALPGISSSKNQVAAKAMADQLKAYDIHGASVAVIHDGQLHWSKAYGITDVKNPQPVTTQTLFQCASIGKVITALAALKLVEQGKIGLDENVNGKLKRWQIKENKYTKLQPVTLRHLLSHSAGFTDGYGFLGYSPGSQIPALLEILNNDPIANGKKKLVVNAIPGEVEQYSGGGYLIVQLLIEDISGKPFAQYVHEQLLEPLGMKSTTYEPQPDENKGYTIARGHKGNGKAYMNKKYHIYPEQAAAGPWTTSEDLARLVIAIQEAIQEEENAVLNQELIAEFISPQINNKGLGANLRGIEKPRAFWHAGQNLGYTGLFYGLTEKGEGAIILLNSEGGEALMQEFISSVATVYNWPVMKSYVAMEIPEKEKQALAGSYEQVDQSKKLAIIPTKDGLLVKPANARKGVALYKIGENHYTFLNAQDYIRLSFKFEGNEAVSLIYAESIGKSMELKKVD